jgi:hypothetical protein
VKTSYHSLLRTKTADILLQKLHSLKTDIDRLLAIEKEGRISISVKERANLLALRMERKCVLRIKIEEAWLDILDKGDSEVIDRHLK